MVMNCAVCGCRSVSSTDKVGYYVVPSIITRQDDETRDVSIRRRRLWIARLGQNVDERRVNSNTRVCGKHFVSGRPAKLRDLESVDWVPTIGVHTGSDDIVNDYNYDRLSIKSEAPSPVYWGVDVQMANDHQFGEEVEENFSCADNSCQTDILSDDIIDKDFHCQVIADNMALRNEVSRLKAKICEFSEEQLVGDDSKVRFYSGLPTFSALKHVFELTSVKVAYNSSTSLSRFQEFMVVMLRFRLNLLEQDLAFRFGVCQGVIISVLKRWLPVMSAILGKFINWPQHEVLSSTMPECYRAAFGNRAVLIINSLGMSVERQPSFAPKAENWSQNENDKTVTFLIGSSPQGIILFVLKMCVGHSGNNLIESSKVLENLSRGDVVLTDGTINIEQRMGMYLGKLNIPVYVKGRIQSPLEEEQAARELDNLKIYVENKIGSFKQEFRILQSPLPLDYLCPFEGDVQCPIDHIITICCALVNFCLSVTS